MVLSGRPRILNDVYSDSSAVIAAWLPGTSGGQGIMNAITGDYVVRPGGATNRKNSLSIDWPRDMVIIYVIIGKLERFPSVRN